jgi:cytoskeletal protein CcmA (bactofilin family)
MTNGDVSHSIITAEVEIKGTIKSSGSVRLDGKLEGDLVCVGDAFIGKAATIKGTISANSVSIEGTINGTINAKDKIEMKATAHIMGDIKSRRLAVEDGVTFIGKSDVNPAAGPAGAAKSEPAEAADSKPSFLGRGKSAPFSA